MQWSSKHILKDIRMEAHQKPISIETIVPLAPKPVRTSEPIKEKKATLTPEQRRAFEEQAAKEREAARLAAELKKLNQLKEEMLAQAQTQAQQILEEAQLESEQIKKVAYQAAFEQGEKAGNQAGYQAGIEQATVTAHGLLQTAQANAEAIFEESQKYVQEKKSEWTEAVVQMAEALIKKQFSVDEQTILAVLEPLWLEIEQPDQMLLVRTHPDHVQVLKERLEEKKKEISHFRYVVLKEESYHPYQVEIESDEMLLTFDLEKELHTFLQQLKKDE